MPEIFSNGSIFAHTECECTAGAYEPVRALNDLMAWRIESLELPICASFRASSQQMNETSFQFK
jgi:hypothetical protein